MFDMRPAAPAGAPLHQRFIALFRYGDRYAVLVSQADEGAAEGIQFALVTGSDVSFEGARGVHVVAF